MLQFEPTSPPPPAAPPRRDAAVPCQEKRDVHGNLHADDGDHEGKQAGLFGLREELTHERPSVAESSQLSRASATHGF